MNETAKNAKDAKECTDDFFLPSLAYLATWRFKLTGTLCQQYMINTIIFGSGQVARQKHAYFPEGDKFRRRGHVFSSMAG
jgi:hypothetical protein